jgi:DNA-binding transcriptional regulator YdaS (Cro superfamily)
MPPADRKAFAEGCGVSLGHLNNIAYECEHKSCSAELAIEIERESKRAVTCEELCPDVDWAVLRGTKAAKQRQVA